MNALKYYRSITPARNAWKESLPQVCMGCGREVRHVPRQFLEIHEILRRSQAPGKWFFEANLLLLCCECHSDRKIAASNRESIIYQLALKKLRDGKHYDLEQWLSVRNPRAMQYVTEEEVQACLEQLSTT